MEAPVINDVMKSDNVMKNDIKKNRIGFRNIRNRRNMRHF